MFKRSALYVKVGFALLLVFSLFHVSVVRKSDLKKYARLLKKYETNATTRSLPTAAHQTRQQVSKEIWFTQEDKSRLQYRIFGKTSLLTLEPNGKKILVLENLHDLKCFMQDKLYFAAQKQPMQQMRFWEADRGIYRYTNQQLVAEDVNISIFRLPDHALPKTCDPTVAFLNGIANNVSFSITGKTPQFKANQFKATLTKTEL